MEYIIKSLLDVWAPWPEGKFPGSPEKARVVDRQVIATPGLLSPPTSLCARARRAGLVGAIQGHHSSTLHPTSSLPEAFWCLGGPTEPFRDTWFAFVTH